MAVPRRDGAGWFAGGADVVAGLAVPAVVLDDERGHRERVVTPPHYCGDGLVYPGRFHVASEGRDERRAHQRVSVADDAGPERLVSGGQLRRAVVTAERHHQAVIAAGVGTGGTGHAGEGAVLAGAVLGRDRGHQGPPVAA